MSAWDCNRLECERLDCDRPEYKILTEYKLKKEKLHGSSRSEKADAGCSFFVFWINRSREMAGIEIACSEYAVNGMTEMRSSAYTYTFLWQSVRITLCRKWLCANPAVPPPGTMAGRRCCPGRLQCDPRISRRSPEWHSRPLCRKALSC